MSIASLLSSARAAAARHALVTGIAATTAAGVVGLGIGFDAGHAAAAPVATSQSPSAPAPTLPTAPQQQNGKSAKQAAGAEIARALVKSVATLTNQSTDAVVADLRQGQTLAQIAGDQSQAAEQQVMAQLKQKADAAVAAGKMTADQETQRLSKAQAALDKAMNAPGAQVAGLLAAGKSHGAAGPSPSPMPSAMP